MFPMKIYTNPFTRGVNRGTDRIFYVNIQSVK